MGRIEADITLESWLFGFQPCSGQGQFTLISVSVYEKRMKNCIVKIIENVTYQKMMKWVISFQQNLTLFL